MPISNPTVVSGTLTGVDTSPEIEGYGVDIYGSGTGPVNIEFKKTDGSWLVLEAFTPPSRTFDPKTRGALRLASEAGANFAYEMRARPDKVR